MSDDPRIWSKTEWKEEMPGEITDEELQVLGWVASSESADRSTSDQRTLSPSSIVEIGNLLSDLELTGLQLCLFAAIRDMESKSNVASATNIHRWLIDHANRRYQDPSATHQSLKKLASRGLLVTKQPAPNERYTGGPELKVKYSLSKDGEDAYEKVIAKMRGISRLK